MQKQLTFLCRTRGSNLILGLQTQSQVLYLDLFLGSFDLRLWKAKLYSDQTCCKPLQVFLDSEKKKKKIGFWQEASLGQASPTQCTAEKLLFSKLALEEYLKCSLKIFLVLAASFQTSVFSCCLVLISEWCWFKTALILKKKKRFFSFFNSFYLRLKLFENSSCFEVQHWQTVTIPSILKVFLICKYVASFKKPSNIQCTFVTNFPFMVFGKNSDISQPAL